MAQPPADLSAILAALAAQRPASTPNQQQAPGQGPPPGMPLPGQFQMPPGLPQGGIPSYPFPQPTSSGSLDLSGIKPVNSGAVNINDALAKARSFAAEKGVSYDSGRNSSGGHGRSRTRSRSPQRDRYNAFREERRDGYGRERSRSPQRGQRFSPPPTGRGYGRERSPPRRDNDDSEVISIDSNLVGLVIGRQGENLRRIEETTGARIQFITPPDHGGAQRQCRVSGNPRVRAEAKHEIFRTIDDNAAQSRDRGSGGAGGGMQGGGMQANRQQSKTPSQPVLREGENAMQIMVPDRTVGLIIGRGGETIRDLQERSGCHINIVGVNKSVNGLRPVNLIGTAQASQLAKDLIMEIVESDTRGPGQNDDPTPLQKQAQNNRPQQQDNSYGGGQQHQQQQQQPGKINATIHVPSEAVGMIIGKGGETIKDMQQSTGCKINVTQASGPDIEREIGLIGTSQAIEAAKSAIWEKVDLVREKNGGGGGRGNNNRDNDRYSQNQSSNYGGGQQSSGYGQQPGGYGGAQQQSAPAAAAGGDAAADPYAAYGGYQNYMALWYAALANGAKPPGQEGAGQ